VKDEGELEEILRAGTSANSSASSSFAFDLDIYNLLQKSLNKYLEIILLEQNPLRRRVKSCELPGLDEEGYLCESSLSN
jgi:hypothetical protein